MTNNRPMREYVDPLEEGNGAYSNGRQDPKAENQYWSTFDESTTILPEKKPEGNSPPARTNYDPKTQRR